MTTPDPRATALARYRAGATGHEIADQLEVDPSTVRRWIAQETQLRRVGPRGRTDVPTRLIVQLRDVDRLTWAAIATEVAMSKTGVKSRYEVATEGQRRWR